MHGLMVRLDDCSGLSTLYNFFRVSPMWHWVVSETVVWLFYFSFRGCVLTAPNYYENIFHRPLPWSCSTLRAYDQPSCGEGTATSSFCFGPPHLLACIQPSGYCPAPWSSLSFFCLWFKILLYLLYIICFNNTVNLRGKTVFWAYLVCYFSALLNDVISLRL